jgi:putative intracellular protease/amidase
MNIAFIIYDGMTALDFIGVYDPLTRLKTMDFALLWKQYMTIQDLLCYRARLEIR